LIRAEAAPLLAPEHGVRMADATEQMATRSDDLAVGGGRSVSRCRLQHVGLGASIPVALGGPDSRCYRTSSRLVTTSSVGQGGPARSARRSSSPNHLPFGNSSPRSQRHAATIARTSCQHSSRSPWSTPG